MCSSTANSPELEFLPQDTSPQVMKNRPTGDGIRTGTIVCSGLLLSFAGQILAVEFRAILKGLTEA
jgi:hypothetical protein